MVWTPTNLLCGPFPGVCKGAFCEGGNGDADKFRYQLSLLVAEAKEILPEAQQRLVARSEDPLRSGTASISGFAVLRSGQVPPIIIPSLTASSTGLVCLGLELKLQDGKYSARCVNTLHSRSGPWRPSFLRLAH